MGEGPGEWVLGLGGVVEAARLGAQQTMGTTGTTRTGGLGHSCTSYTSYTGSSTQATTEGPAWRQNMMYIFKGINKLLYLFYGCDHAATDRSILLSV